MKAIFSCITFMAVGLNLLGQQNDSGGKDPVLTILYDNRSVSDSISADHGFSCLVEKDGNKCLFDTGRIPGKLIMSMDRLNVNYSEINDVFISHIHNDHMDGLKDVLGKCNKPVLYMPVSYPQLINEPPSDQADRDWQELLDQYKPLVSELIQKKGPSDVGNIGFSTGAIENIYYEQSLIIPSSKGLIIMIGCAHPGILEIVKQVKLLKNQDVFLVLGGFHLDSADSEDVKYIAEELKELTKFIAPCHCTGGNAMEIIHDIFKEDYIDIKAGSKIDVEHLL